MWYPNTENPIFGTFVHEQVAALKRCGIEIEVAQPLPSTPFPISLMSERYRKLSEIPEEEIYKGIKVHHPRYVTLPRHLFYQNVGNWMYRGTVETISKIYKKLPFDIIHAHGTYPCGWCANLIRDKNLSRIRTVHTIHRVSVIDIPKFNKQCSALVNESLRRSDWNVFVSMEGFELGLSYTNGRIKERSSYITNGVNISQFSLTEEDEKAVHELREKYRNSSNILFIGYLIERKGIKELLRAYEMLGDYGVKGKTRLFLVGRNMLGGYVERFVKERKLEDRIITTGAVLHDHVKRWLKFADIFILPSHSEGLATVLFEALYMGKPAIFTKVGGTCDIVKDMEHAVLINAKSETEIAKALSLLINDPGLCRRLGDNGYRLIRDHYTWEINAKKNLEVYEKVLALDHA
jgi:glycosyltransferase involved in cell wall biosynthesis